MISVSETGKKQKDMKQPLSGMWISCERCWEVRRQLILFQCTEAILGSAIFKIPVGLRAELIGWSRASSQFSRKSMFSGSALRTDFSLQF